MTDDMKTLIAMAITASDNAYVPYSNYRVGALLRSMDGRLFTGCNIENASYPASICAERTALVKAVSDGAQSFDLMIVATRNGGEPCGICRQMVSEFASTMRVLIVTFAGDVVLDTSMAELLPHSFTPADLDE